jgi:hypothetical protein
VAKSPLFFVNYIYLLNFLSQLNKKKSGKVGRKPANPHEYWVFPSPLLFLKVGRKWANGHFFSQNRPKTLQNSNQKWA